MKLKHQEKCAGPKHIRKDIFTGYTEMLNVSFEAADSAKKTSFYLHDFANNVPAEILSA